MMNSLESFNKLIESVEANNKYNNYTLFVGSEKIKNIANEYFPGLDIFVLPNSIDKDKLFIIPNENIKPIRF